MKRVKKTNEEEVTLIIKFEEGTATMREILELFSSLGETAYNLQGFYGRAMESLIDNGYLSTKFEITGYGLEIIEESEEA